MEFQFKVKVSTDMHVHIAIYKAAELMKSLGCGAVKIAKLKTAISELGQNILKYAGEGDISMYKVSSPRQSLRVLVVDKGPGIADLEEALKDNYSSSGTLGLGLPGVRRMVDEFAIRSRLGQGTEVEISLYLD